MLWDLCELMSIILMIYITECTQNGCSDRSVSREPSGYTSFLVLLTYFIVLFHFVRKYRNLLISYTKKNSFDNKDNNAKNEIL